MKDKEKTFKIVSLVGSILTIISFIILMVTLIKVDRIEELVGTSKNWIMSLKINEPRDGTEIPKKEKVIKIAGKFEFYTTAAEAQNKGPVNLIMHQNSVDLICYIRLFSQNSSNQNKYHRQSEIIVNQNGNFEGLITLGNLKEDDLETRVQIIVLAVPKKSIPEGLIHVELPLYLEASKVVVVKRIR
jgi:hypothetical protein